MFLSSPFTHNSMSIYYGVIFSYMIYTRGDKNITISVATDTLSTSVHQSILSSMFIYLTVFHNYVDLFLKG